MLRRILAPLSPPSSSQQHVAGGGDGHPEKWPHGPPLSLGAGEACVYRKEPPPHGAKDVLVGQPQNFKLLAHVECDPETGLYTGMDEFLTLAVSSKGRIDSLAPADLARADSVIRADSFANIGPDGVLSMNLDSAALRDGSERRDNSTRRRTRRPGTLLRSVSTTEISGSSSRRPPKIPSGSQSPGSPPVRKTSPRKSGARSLFSKPSMPTSVTHAVHVSLDPSHPTGFAGLPPAWETLLLFSGIDKGEALRHPQELVDVLNFSKTTDTPKVAASNDELDSFGDMDLPPIQYTFPRTPTVTSFDDTSDHSVNPEDAAESSHLEHTHRSADAPKDPAHVPPQSRSTRVMSNIRSYNRTRGKSRTLSHDVIETTAEDTRSHTDEENPRGKSLSPVIADPRASGLVALASKCGFDNVIGASFVDDADQNVTETSCSEDEMRKVIGGDRVAFLPDCLPDDSAMLDIRIAKFESAYGEVKKIGAGSSGSVYSAVRLSDGKRVAVKQVKPANESDWTLYRYEAHVMTTHSNQKNLMSCFDAFRDGEYLYMILELMSASLSDILEKRRAGAFNRALASSTASLSLELREPISASQCTVDGRSRIPSRKKSRPVSVLAMAAGFEEDFIAFVCKEVLCGLEQVHMISRVHRDIKSDNILVRPDGAVKIADFGFCAELMAGARNTVVGTPYQMAPEVIRGRDYGTPVDIWSAGVLAYELAEGAPPHEGLTPIRAMFKIATSDPPALGDMWSPVFRDFVASCCSVDPTERPTASEALSHPFIASACTQGDAVALLSSLCAK